GFYTQYLKDALQKFYPENTYYFLENKNDDLKDAELIHYPFFDPFFRTLPLIKKRKTVVTVHDLTPLVFPEHFPAGVKGNLNWQLQKLALKNADPIITDSEASKLDIERF